MWLGAEDVNDTSSSSVLAGRKRGAAEARLKELREEFKRQVSSRWGQEGGVRYGCDMGRAQFQATVGSGLCSMLMEVHARCEASAPNGA